jgi:sn-glycerol 3-phosphate transport system substrate-binding protein
MRVIPLSAALLAAGLLGSAAAQAQTEIQWWHSMTGALGDKVNEIANGFNASQKEYKILPVYKGAYPESMTAAIAAFRAGNAPHILQVFEVGTATMMAAKGAIKPVYQMMKEANEPFDSKNYLPAVAGYYTDSKGNMLSLPFNSSTPVFYINKDAFRKAGINPDPAPKTWKEFAIAAGKLKASGQSCVYSSGWPSWVHIENFSAWHNLPIGTKENGMAGMDTEFQINSPAHVEHIAMLADFAKKGWFTYSGKRNEARSPLLQRRMRDAHLELGGTGQHPQGAKFEFSVNFLPYHDDNQGCAAEFHHRRRHAVGHERQEAGRIQRRGQVLQLSVARPRYRPTGTQSPDTCRSPTPPTKRRGSPATTRRTRARTSRSGSLATSRPRQTPRACASAISCRDAT